ncbi:TonB-dependent copper receptor [Burkholderia ubonensis]|uniref:TonB-dependent copper receptor n=1 Tax=Burkholderia ubonensis TaxID=101571 RepID=UPI0009B4638E|nr:TonB-dependent copper receptor [Burkholderia ubonensis]
MSRSIPHRSNFVRWPLRPAVIALAAGLAFAAPALAFAAQTDSSSPTVQPSAPEQIAATTLDPIVVVASPESTPLVVKTDPKAPRQPLPASDGADYLKTIPGFSAIRSGGTNGDLVFRGMFGSRLNILTNGTTMLGACGSRMDSPASYISPESYDKLTVIKGPESVIYGPTGSAATVLFERDTKRFDKPGIRFDGSLVGGSFGRNDQNADLTVGNDKVYARVIANHAHEDDYEDGNGNTVPSRWDKWNVDTAIGVTPDDHTRIELTAGTGDGYARYAARGMDGVHFRRDSVGLRFDKSHIGDVLDRVEAQVYYNVADHVMDNYTLRTPTPMSGMAMAMASDVSRTTLGARAAATLRFADRFKLVAGADMQTNRLYSRSGMDAISYDTQPWAPSATFDDVGAFGELTWDLTDTQRLVGGVRLDHVSARDDRSSISGMMGKAMPNPTAHAERAATLPSGFVRYEQDLASRPASWYVGLGHAERFPDYWELFSPQQGPDGSVNAFSSIKPEKTTQLDIGAQWKTQPLDVWVSAYAGYVQDFILFDYKSMGTKMGATSQASNVNARIMGGEFGATWRPSDPLSFTGALAYAWGQNAATGAPLPQIPPLDARFGVEYKRGPWSAGGLWRVVAAQHRVAVDEGNVAGKDFGPSAGFGVLSLHAGYAISKTMDLAVGVDNLLDKAYAEHLNLAGNAGFGFPANTPLMEPGRTAWARLSIKMK